MPKNILFQVFLALLKIRVVVVFPVVTILRNILYWDSTLRDLSVITVSIFSSVANFSVVAETHLLVSGVQ